MLFTGVTSFLTPQASKLWKAKERRGKQRCHLRRVKLLLLILALSSGEQEYPRFQDGAG